MRRIPELDALRGLAALAIVALHLWIPTVALAGTAVDLFFVLSGYLITTIILKELGRPHFLRTFYIRRALRIWPIYYLALFGTVIACLCLREPIDDLPDFLFYLQRVQNYWFGRQPAFCVGFAHTWTLAIEEQFYLFWPLMLMACGRASVVPLSLALVVVAVAARSFGFDIWLLLTRCDGLALGALLAAIMDGEPERRRTDRRLALAFALAVLLRFVGKGGILGAHPTTALSLKMLSVNLGYLALVGTVVRHSGAAWLGFLRLRPLEGLGKISYGIYLYHYIIFHLLDRFGWTNGATADSLKLGLSLGVSVLSWRYIERPILGLKDRFDYRGADDAPRSPDGGRLLLSTSG